MLATPDVDWRQQLEDAVADCPNSNQPASALAEIAPLLSLGSCSHSGALNFGVTYPDTVDRLGQVDQFQKKALCPEDGVFAGPTYCDTIIR